MTLPLPCLKVIGDLDWLAFLPCD